MQPTAERHSWATWSTVSLSGLEHQLSVLRIFRSTYVSFGMLLIVQFLYARPNPDRRFPLPSQPVLESWIARGHPDQQKLARYLDELERLTADASGERD
jgi:hypothetical protein